MAARTFERVFFVALPLQVLLLAVVPARGDYRESYSNGVKAVDQEKWSEAEQFMLQAIGERPQAEDRRVRIYGQRFESYTPHFYLGLARFHQNNCPGALRDWRLAADQEVVLQERRKADLLTELRGQCLAQQWEPAVQEAERALASAEGLANSLSEAREDPDLAAIWQGDPSLSRRQVAARRNLRQARDRLSRGTQERDLAQVSEAAELAATANRQLAALGNDLEEARHNALAAALSQAEAEIGRAETAAAALNDLRRDPSLGPFWQRQPTLDQRRTGAQGLLSSARSRLEAGRARESLSQLSRAEQEAVQARQDFDAVLDEARGQRLGEAAAIQRRIEQETTRAQAEVARAESASDLLEAYRRHPSWQQSELLGRREDPAQRLLAEARQRLKSGSSGGGGNRLTDLQAAQDLAARATKAYEAIALDARRLLAGQPDEPLDPIRDALRQRIAETQNLLDDLPPTGRLRTAAARRQRGQVEELMAQAQGVSDSDAPETVDALRRNLDAAVAVLREMLRRPGGPPAELRAAAAAYFRAEYEQTLDILNEQTFEDPRAQVQGCLFRAAAGYALYEIQERTQQELLDQVFADIRSCRRLDPKMTPDPEYFTPAFVALFDGGS